MAWFIQSCPRRQPARKPEMSLPMEPSLGVQGKAGWGVMLAGSPSTYDLWRRKQTGKRHATR